MAGDDGELSIFSSNNDDIIVEILSWLPVICLLRFRCVCKSWRALISTSQFVAKHRVRSNDNDNNKNVLIVFQRPDDECPHLINYQFPSRFPQLIDYQSLKKKENVAAAASAATAIRSRPRELEEEFPDDTSLNDSSVVGSCNGLVCLLLNPPNGYYRRKDHEKRRLVVWNPSTRKTRKLPDMDWFFFGPRYYGFGYDSTTQDYKVLLGGYNSYDDPGFVAIFALKTASWKIVSGDHLGAASVEIYRRGCFLNGALHWDEKDYQNPGSRIRSFDFAQEKFRLCSFIRHKGSTNGAGVGTVGNRLFFYTSCHISTPNSPHLEDAGLTIWVMMEYGVDQSWTLFAKIRSEIIPPNVRWLYPISPIEDDGEVLMGSNHSDLVLYYIPKEKEEEEDTCRIVHHNPGIHEFQALEVEAVMYAETLVSPVTGDG